MTGSGEPARRTDKSALLSVAEAAAHLGVAEAFVRRLVLRRRIRFYKVGHYVRFRVADLNAFVEAGRQDPIEVDVHAVYGRGRPATGTRTGGQASRGA